jgi:hypothetical protein
MSFTHLYCKAHLKNPSDVSLPQNLLKKIGNYLFPQMNYQKNARCPHELPTRPKKSIELPQLHVLPLSVSLTRENT